MKTFLTVASHWSAPGIRQYASQDRAAAERKAAELVDELRDDWAVWASRAGDATVPPSVKDGGGDWEATLRALQLSRLIDYFGGEGEANDALYEHAERKCLSEPPLIGEGFTNELQLRIAAFVEEDDCVADKIGFPMVWIEEVDQAEPPAETPPLPADVAAIRFALRNAKGAIQALLHQTGQRRGMFTDEDGTIQDAVDAGEAAEIEIENAIAALDEASPAPPEAALFRAIIAERDAWTKHQAPPGEDNENRDQEEADAVVETLNDVLRAAEQPQKARVAVVISGGVLQSVVADQPGEIILVDYDIDHGDGIFPMVEQESGNAEPAFVAVEEATVDSRWLDMVTEASAAAAQNIAAES